MANVVRIHVNGSTYTHASATSLSDPAVAGLWEKVAKHQLVNPLAPLLVDIKGDAGACTLMLFPQLVWSFAMSVVDSASTTTSGSSGLGLTLGL